jgi:hypothetical protein
MSISARFSATVAFPTNSAEILRVIGYPKPIQDNGPRQGPEFL